MSLAEGVIDGDDDLWYKRKSCDLQRSKENKTHKVKDTDKLVSFLLTKPPFLQEAEDIAQQHDLSVKLMKNEGPGLLLIGSQISSQAMSQIDGLVDQIKQHLVPEVAPLPCHFIPLFEEMVAW